MSKSKFVAMNIKIKDKVVKKFSKEGKQSILPEIKQKFVNVNLAQYRLIKTTYQ